MIKILLALILFAVTAAIAFSGHKPAGIHSTVIISNENFSFGAIHGTGFFVKDDVIVTARHVIEALEDKSEDIKVYTSSGEIIYVEDFEVMPNHDVGVLKLKKPPVERSTGNFSISCEDIVRGQTLVTLGNPLHVRWGSVRIHVVGGYWAGNLDSKNLRDTVLIQGPLAPGISGSPVVFKEGSVVGLSNTLMPIANMGRFYIPSGIGTIVHFKPICKELHDLIEGI